MKAMDRLNKVILMAGFSIIWIASSAQAENWVGVVNNPGGDPAYINVDVDSILRRDDGLVYFDVEDDMGISASAVDCQEQIYYVIGNNMPDWKSHPYQIKPGTNTAKEADFVCSRASA
ncbi:MAG TPA: hypothetical protein VD883_01620 [Candidatus Omnitrophota bacterium]|nr:hypothetical protein [Candidatus Omnitrophota bacterium]